MGGSEVVHVLGQAVTLLAASVLVLLVCHRLRLSPVVGLLLTGMLIGPSGLGLLAEVETLQHKKPTFHGDTIYAVTKVVDKRESQSKPDRGVVTVETKGINQRDEEVCFFRRKVLIWKKEHTPTRRYPDTDEVFEG